MKDHSGQNQNTEISPLLEVRNLNVSFDTEEGILQAAGDVSFTLKRGRTLGLVGESGCGKSVSCMSIPRLIPQPPGRITSGEILLDGVDILKLKEDKMRAIRGKDIGVIFQEPMTALSPLVKVDTQVAETFMLHTAVSRREALQQAHEWLVKVGIPATAFRSYPFELSGGMRQRVMIAMALALHPKLIIADEPTTALDVTIQAQILELMGNVRGKDSGLLLITHDMGVIWEMCDDMAVMYASRIVESGPVREIFADPLHPYTRGLMRSIPALNRDAKRLEHIPGHVPSLMKLPEGCAFADRCPHSTEICRKTRPEMKKTDDGRTVACHLVNASLPKNDR